MTRYLLPLLLGFGVGVVPTGAGAQPGVPVRMAEHPGHTRIVFDWPQRTRYEIQKDAQAGRVDVRFPEAAAFDLARVRPARHLRGIEAEGNVATLLSVPGVEVRHFRLGERVIVDLMKPAPPAAPEAPPAATAKTLSETAPVVAANPTPLADGRFMLASAALDEVMPIMLARAAAEDAAPVVLAQATPPAAAPAQLPPQRRPAPPAAALPSIVPAPEPAAPAAAPATTPIRIEAGTGRLVSLPGAATTVMAADPRVVRVQPSSPTSIFLMAGAPGRTNIIATNDAGQQVVEFDVTVVPPGAGVTGQAAPTGAAGPSPRTPSAQQIEAQIRALVPGPGQVRVRVTGRTLVLTGSVPTAADARRAEAVARGMAQEETTILNEIAVLASIQVNLRVRVAEISREVTRQFGFNWQVLGQTGNFAFGLRSGALGFPPAAIAGLTPGGRFEGGLLASGAGTSTVQRFGMGFSSGGWDVNSLIDALAVDNLVTILAEPNLTAQSGEVASFLAGGEFPVPVSAGNNGQVGIEFKPFGVSLAFVPTVMSNERLALRVRPEVSELSEQGSISVPLASGTVRIPALTVRRAETTVELGSGQSFAIAGLLQRTSLQSQDGINGLVDVPVLGALFRSDRFQRRETELVIIVTPYLVQPVSDPTALAAPTDNFRPATSLERILMQRQTTAAPQPVPGVPAGIGFRVN